MADDIIAGRLRGVRVLAVDDNDDSRDLLAMALGYAGAVVTTASSAREALPHIPEVEIVVTDMSMAQVEQSRRPVPVIVLTGFDHRDFPGAKFARVLRKPFDLWRLCQEIRAVLGGPGRVSAAQ
jgi:CheY-like chemotaxis protein